MKEMQHGFKKYIAVFCTALILSLAAGIGPVAAVALAESTDAGQIGQVTNEGSGSPASSTGSAAGSSSGPSSSGSAESSSEAVSSGQSSSSEASDMITVRFNLNGGTGMKTSASLEKGTSVSQLKTPTRTGYRFAGWSEGGAVLPASKILDKDTTLTANWKKEAGSEEGTASVDTHQNEVDAAASAARAAISDPDVLSSEDWGAILSASSAQSGVSSAVSSGPVSSAADSSGGFSKLLLAGIGLIVLGAAGVVAFIYLQFIRKPPRGGPHNGSGGGRRGADDDTMTFTDISSYSDGKKPDDASAVLYPQTPPRTPPAGGGPASARQSAPVRQAASARQAAYDRKKREARLQASRANAAAAGGSNFDWQRFFDSERN